MYRRVDFPEPEGPVTVVTDPAGKPAERSSMIGSDLFR